MPRPRTRPRTRLLVALAVALPGLLVAAAGLLHPLFLTPDTAERWRAAHVVLLPGFPLVGLAVGVVLRGEGSPLATVARVLAAGYALLYSALDAIAGLGAPHQVIRTSERGEPFPPIGDLYEIGDRLGHAGVVLLALSALLAAGLLARRSGSPLALAGGVVVAAACVPFWQHHVFPGLGTAALVGVGLGTALLELGRAPRDPAPVPRSV